MITVEVDRELAERLSKITGTAEVRDADGRVIGAFLPVRFTRDLDEPLPPPLSEEDLERGLEGPRFTTGEVLATLRSLG